MSWNHNTTITGFIAVTITHTKWYHNTISILDPIVWMKVTSWVVWCWKKSECSWPLKRPCLGQKTHVAVWRGGEQVVSSTETTLKTAPGLIPHYAVWNLSPKYTLFPPTLRTPHWLGNTHLYISLSPKGVWSFNSYCKLGWKSATSLISRPIWLSATQLGRPGSYPCIRSVLPPLTLMVAVAVASDFSSLVCASTCVRISVMLVSRTIPPMHISWRIFCTCTKTRHRVKHVSWGGRGGRSIPCQHERSNPAHTHSQSSDPVSPQKPVKSCVYVTVRECVCEDSGVMYMYSMPFVCFGITMIFFQYTHTRQMLG